jgi:hypothetical protein
MKKKIYMKQSEEQRMSAYIFKRSDVKRKGAGILMLCALLFLLPGENRAYNSEEHKLIADLGVAGAKISGVKLPPHLELKIVNKSYYVQGYKYAKNLAVGFSTNDQNDYDKDKKGVQDNCYWTGFGQLKYNKAIWIPQITPVPLPNSIPGKVFNIPTYAGSRVKQYTFGELVALYGDYRRSNYSKQPDQCYLTNADVDTIHFSRGTRLYKKYCPAPVPGYAYLRSIGSGLVPPFGEVANASSNTANDDEYNEAGWWGDEMLRIANVNDWHFSNGAVAWYTGLHRLALYYVNKATLDPRYWVQALHYEANALHALTDLFAFGHVVTNRGETSYGIMKSNDLLNKNVYLWMENVIKMGGGVRLSNGKISSTAILPDISDRTVQRNSFLKSYRGTWALRARREQKYHDYFNDKGAKVRNLHGAKFYIFGDGKLHKMDQHAHNQISQAVKVSVQSLFDAYESLQKRKIKLADLIKPGSFVFEALKYIPVYIEKDPDKYFLGRWTLYAKAIDQITGAGKVPRDWDKCKIPYLSGKDYSWPAKHSKKCTEF